MGKSGPTKHRVNCKTKFLVDLIQSPKNKKLYSREVRRVLQYFLTLIIENKQYQASRQLHLQTQDVLYKFPQSFH